MKYYIADTHFGHANIIKYDERPFSNVDEMDECLISRWNEKVSDNDEIYMIGDFAFSHGKSADWYLKRLKGRKHLIIGNHENSIMDNSKAKSLLESINYMKEISDYMRQMAVKVVLCHYPLAEWNGIYKGWYHVYGHIHNNPNDAYEIMRNKDHAFNAGCMINGYVPVTLEELRRNMDAYWKAGQDVKAMCH